ncbi:CDP-glycerol glycerophosphotransferase [Sinosporangium album]|uniref:CDP-glycerol glycerophosphotransferase n=1 Tax=Sinosporangium album TaxID=504805 RepID=A0A1G7Y9E1_9ACTN|nr:CDP-glycerol glycerophosphotransferase family protein [Sinosporangium album]SDG92936.1 CDP-glycerol glycerophosphotransferase [Sinosporangium album]
MATGVTATQSDGDLVADRLRAVQDLCDRGEPLDEIMKIIRSGGLTPRERRDFDAQVLAGPLGTRFDTAVKRGPARRGEFLGHLKPYLATVDPKVKVGLPVERRIAYYLVEQRDESVLTEGDDLLRLVTAAAEPQKRVRTGLRWYADLPFQDQLPKSLYRLRAADLVPITQIDDISWVDGRLRITGHAYLAGLSVRGRRFNRATVVLRGPRWLPPVRLRTRRTHCPEATHGAREPGCNYDWSGFVAELHPGSLRWRAGVRALARGARRLLRRRPAVPETTTWRAEIVIWSRAARAVGLLKGPVPGRTERPTGLAVGDRRFVRPVWTSDRAVQVVLQPTRAELRSVRLDDDRLALTVFLPGRPTTRGHARLGGHRMSADFTPVDGGTDVVVDLAVSSLLQEKDGRRLWIEPKGDPAAPVMLGSAAEARLLSGDREITVLADRRDRVVVSAHRARPVITSVAWTDGAVLTLSGSYPDPERGRRVLTLRNRTGLLYEVPLERDGDRFTARFSPAAMERFGDAVPLASGNWTLTVRHPVGEVVPVRVAHDLLPSLDEGPRMVAGREYRLVSTRFDVPMISVGEDRPADEMGAAGLYALRRTVYPAERSAPLREATVYVVNDGRHYADNARAIYEERLRRGDDREHIWVVKDGAFTPPGSAELGLGGGIAPTVVRAGGRGHYAALARSRFVVANGLLPQWFRARDDQTVVQLWNGTPVKHIGNDLPHMSRDPKPPVWYRQAADVRGWDLLVTQSTWASSVMRQAFGYQGEVLECGFPRNDLLSLPDRESLAADVRRRLGVPEGRKIVLYAPTWRDYDRKNGTVKLDVRLARRVLGADHHLLVRAHPMQAVPMVPVVPGPGSVGARAGSARPFGPSHRDDFITDVTTYPDIAELMLVADVLVTDYSSTMFDFVATGRPVVILAYDLERYANKRGLYLDIDGQAPGPVVSTAAQAVEAIRDITTISARFANRYAAFRTTYAPRDDGKATDRFIEHVFEPA